MGNILANKVNITKRIKSYKKQKHLSSEWAEHFDMQMDKSAHSMQQ